MNNVLARYFVCSLVLHHKLGLNADVALLSVPVLYFLMIWASSWFPSPTCSYANTYRPRLYSLHSSHRLCIGKEFDQDLVTTI
jgi:hypothetical protein